MITEQPVFFLKFFIGVFFHYPEIQTDFSNGNDGVVLKGSDKLADIKGRNVNLVELSVSHYLLARALDSVGMTERDIKVINTSDADMVAVYSTDSVNAVVTWNPLLMEVTGMPDSHKVFDSSQIPGEIIDLISTIGLGDKSARSKDILGRVYEALVSLMEKNNEILHQNLVMNGPTPGGITGKEAPIGPLMFQGDHGPLAYRNIKITAKQSRRLFSAETKIAILALFLL